MLYKAQRTKGKGSEISTLCDLALSVGRSKAGASMGKLFSKYLQRDRFLPSPLQQNPSCLPAQQRRGQH